MPSGQQPYPDLDALLRGAKDSLARADALQASIDADARSMAPPASTSFLGDLATGLREQPYATLQGFLQGAKDPAKRVGTRLAENAVGLGQGILDPIGTAQQTGRSIGSGLAFGQTPTLSEGVKAVTGVDPSSEYPEMAADALTSLLFAHGAGMRGPELGFEGAPHFAVEPQYGPSARGVARLPQNEAPIPVSKFTGSATPQPIAASLGQHPPAPSIIDRLAPLSAAPEPAPPEPSPVFDRFMPNTSAAPESTAPVQEPVALAAPEMPNQTSRRYAPFAEAPEPPAPAPSEPSPLSAWLSKYQTPADVPPPAAPEMATRTAIGGESPLSAWLKQHAPESIPTEPAPAEPVAPEATPTAAVQPKPKLAANELAQMLRGREKFAAQNPDAELAPGSRDELDRMGVEYTRTQTELKRLLGMPDADPVEVARMKQGARELGSRLRSGAKAATAPPPSSKIFADVSSGRAAQFHDVPDGIYNALREKLGVQAQPEPTGPSPRVEPNIAAETEPTVSPDDMHRFMNERGSADVGKLARWLGLPIGGAVLGSLADDNAGEGAVAGGVAGGLAALAGPSLLRAVSSPGGFQAHQTGSLLFSPATVAKIATSNTAGALMKALERGAEQRSFAPIGQMAKELADVPQLWSDAREAFRNPDTSHTRLDQPPQPRGMFGVASRAVGAADAPFRKAMERAGLSQEDALTVTQQREPITPTGQAFLKLQRATPVTRTLIPFMKSAINAGETGLVEPVQSARRLFKGQGTRGDVAKIGMATGAAGAGIVGDDTLSQAPPWLQGLLMAMAGPYSTSMLVGRGIAKGNPFQALQHALPLGQGIDVTPKGWAARVVPRIFWDHGSSKAK